jgi:hypothetical protein
MLTPIEIILHSFVFLLLPMALYSLWAGSLVPNGPGAVLFRAVKHLRLCGDVFLLAVCSTSITRLAVHFGFVDATLGDSMLFYLGFPFMGLLLLYLTLFAKAVIKVQRNKMAHQNTN